LSVSQHLRAKLVGKRFRCKNVDFNSQKLLQLEADCAYVEQRGLRCRFNQEIQIAAFDVFAAEHLTKNANITHAMAQRDLPNAIAVLGKCFGGAHDRIVAEGRMCWQWMNAAIQKS
jgi:hypothetical protein